MKRSWKCLALTMILLFLAGTAQATPISGDIGMIGFGYGFPAIVQLNATEIPAPKIAMTAHATGDFAQYIESEDAVDYYGFTFDPAPSPVAGPLWIVGGFSFVLESIDLVYRDTSQMVFDGFGTLSGNGFDDTYGIWGMTIDVLTNSFSFSNGTTAAPVPEPATMFLFGTGLIGLAGLGRKKFNL